MHFSLLPILLTAVCALNTSLIQASFENDDPDYARWQEYARRQGLTKQQEEKSHLVPRPEPIIVNLGKKSQADAQKRTENIRAAAPSSQAEQRELARAIAASLAESRIQKRQEEEEQTELERALRESLQPRSYFQNAEEIVTHGFGAQISERFAGRFPTFRLVSPDQKGVSCGLNALANLVTTQALAPTDNELTTAKKEDFVSYSQRIHDQIEAQHGCPDELTSDLQIMDFMEESDQLQPRNLFILTYNPDTKTLKPGGAIGKRYDIKGSGGDFLQENFKKLLEDNNDLNLINILLHVEKGHDVSTDHWTALSIFKTASMNEPLLLFTNSLKNNPFEPTKKSYKDAIKKIEKMLVEQRQ